jgi:nucleoside-diphosphate-sugar epimerase
MRVLIIGGTGLISTAITRLLLERGNEVVLFNRGRTPPRIPGGAQTIHGDRLEFEAFESRMAEEEAFDCVIDMVCFHPAEAESLVRAFSGRAGQVIFCSTVDVYARPADRYPMREDEPQRPVSQYGLDKSRCETVLMRAHEAGDFQVTIIRPAYTYGEGGVIIHSFGWGTGYIDRLRKGKPIVVHGDGQSLWVCCHIDDVGAAFAKAAGNEAVFGRPYHVTGEEWMTWNQYHRKVAEAVGAPEPQLVHIPTDLLSSATGEHGEITRTNFQFNNIFDNAAARADLDFSYTVPWVDGVRRTVAWLDANDRIDNSDEDDFDDRVIAAWRRAGERMAEELGESRGPA